MNHTITLTVNGLQHQLKVESGERLLDVLRERLGLIGTKEGCGSGDCGACTVIMDDRPVTACMVLAVAADGAHIRTIEGMEKDGQLHPLQQVFIDQGAVQCGFCTPGMIMAADALLTQNPAPGTEEIKQALAGNMCRCTGYTRIIAAVETAAQRMRNDD